NTDLSVTPVHDLSNHPIYSNYKFGEDDSVIDIGTQPIGVSPGIIGEILEHDAILRAALAELGFELQIHHFLKGADSNFFLERGDMEVVTGGDMPALIACANMDTVVASLIKKGFSSIVAREQILMKASRWTIQSRENLTGQKSSINEYQYTAIYKSELLDVSPVAALPVQDLAPDGRLFRELMFIRDLEMVPDAVEWEKVKACFEQSLVTEILKEVQSYQLQTYDFSWKSSKIEKDGNDRWA
ncbi:MAG: hypothetical protein KAR21_13720, partial [Spirochaetales bacterium]|nr:hypothetical protein [Spirochaetales bacterium]